MAELITVTVMDGRNPPRQKQFRSPKQCGRIIDALKEVYGLGALQQGRITLTHDETVEAGAYEYHVEGAALAHAGGTGAGPSGAALAQATGTAAGPSDTSAELARQLVGGPAQWPPPPAAQVLSFLGRPLACKLPVQQQLYNQLYYQPACSSIMPYLQVQPAAEALATDVGYIVRRVSAHGSESNHIAGLDILIRKWLGTLSELSGQLPHRSDRDTVDQSTATQSNLRPDMCLWVEDMLLFKGEEKRSAEQHTAAVQELTHKMGNWSYTMFGSMPYMPCYAAAGKYLQFYVVLRDSQTAQPVSDRFDVTLVQDRVKVLVTLVNMFHLLKSLAQCLPEVRIPVGRVLYRGDCTVTITARDVLKVVKPFPSSKTCQDLATIEAAYRVASGTQHLVKAQPGFPKLDQLKYTVRLIPVAFHRTPLNDLMLRLAVTGVLRALSSLHTAVPPLVHRDVRWQNVMWASEQVAILADLESVAAMGAADGFRSQAWTESTLLNGAYTKTSDLQLVGRLIAQCAGIASLQAMDFAGKLEVHSYSTSEAALTHPWFSAT